MWRSSPSVSDPAGSGTGAAQPRPAVLVIAGTDSSGGAGLIRDVRVLSDLGVDALCAVTAVTAQSHARVLAIHPIPQAVVRDQIRAALQTRSIGAVKIGMLGTAGAVHAVLEAIPAQPDLPIVLDPVLVSSSGAPLLDEDGRKALIDELLPRVALLTPNVPEAALLSGMGVARHEADLLLQARKLLDLGARAVLLKGGHWDGDTAVDLLVRGPDDVQGLASPRLQAQSRGTGCALASAIAAGLASRATLLGACQQGKRYVNAMLQHALTVQ